MKKFFIFIYRLFVLAVSRPGDFRQILGVANQFLDDLWNVDTDVRRLPAFGFEDLATGNTRIANHFFKNIPASISPAEAQALALLLKRVNARRAFEFGTYKGVSTSQLAENIADGGAVLTLDLPDEAESATAFKIVKPVEIQIASEAGKGSAIPIALLPKIEFLRQDSGKFDPAPYAESIDLVFVDGAHSYDYVRNDSEKGWRMLRPGGVLVWHDFVPNHPDVVRYVLGCGYATGRIAGTALAFAIKAPSWLGSEA